MKPIYLDYNATTPTDPRVVEAMKPFWFEQFGNPSSASHSYGWVSSCHVDMARRTVAQCLKSKPKEIYFTSGATESNNMAILGLAYPVLCPKNGSQKKPHFITSSIEHKAVKDVCTYLEDWGSEITYLPVNQYGQVSPSDVENAIQDNTLLISIMYANNEVGTINPIEEIGAIAKKHNIFFHTDAAQAVGKVDIDVKKSNIDLLSLSGHKIYAPKGIGALYVNCDNPKLKLSPLQFGGAQEKGLRPGTCNVTSIVGLAKAIQLAELEKKHDSDRITKLRTYLFNQIKQQFPHVKLNGHPTHRLYNNLSVSFNCQKATSLPCALKDVAYSSSSACSSSQSTPSYVLKAMGLSDQEACSTLRFGLGRFTTQEDIDFVASKFKILT